MIRIVLREAKINKLFVFFASLGLSVLLAILFVVGNFNSRIAEAYPLKYDNTTQIRLTANSKLFDYSCEGLFVYGRSRGETFDVSVVYKDKNVEIPSYNGGVCVYSVNDEVDAVPDLLSGEIFSLSEQCIWLAEWLYLQLGCDVDSVINVGNRTYRVNGVFADAAESSYYDGVVSFIIYKPAQKGETADFLFVGVTDFTQLTRLANMDSDKVFYDKDGVLELCKGYNVLLVGMTFLFYVLLVLLVVAFVCIVRAYLLERQQFVNILQQNGADKRKLTSLFVSLCVIISVLSCSFAVVWELMFNCLVYYWAENILHITLENSDYLVQWIFGVLLCLLLTVVNLVVMLKDNFCEREAANL